MHVFVAMPYNIKEGINFDKVFSDLIKPALEEEGFDVFRADQELKAGEIRTDMFQELLLADLVIADLTIDNPNVWYELGVRHALRSRGVVIIKSKRENMPFDVYTDRKLSYHLKDGIPDSNFLENDKAALRAMCKATIVAWIGYKVSPVYSLLPFLEEPEWKKLRVGGVAEFWEKQEEWKSKISVARKRQKPGDILVLADEAPIQALRLEAYRIAAKALMDLGQFSFALGQIEKALSIDPKDLQSRQYKGTILGRLKKFELAKEWMRSLVKENPTDSETLAILGRVEKDGWVYTWRDKDKSIEQMADDAAYEEGILRKSIDPYMQGFSLDPRHYYSGINALTLLYLLKHLTGDEGDVTRLRAMEGGIRWATETAISKETVSLKDYWARVTRGDIEILTGDISTIEKYYKNAVAVSENNWFLLDSARQQLYLLRDLGFRPKEVDAAIRIFDKAIEKIIKPNLQTKPRSIFLFSGHMVDAHDRKEPRFPNDDKHIDLAKIAISKKLEELGTFKNDLALCGGACGGDLLFADECLRRELRLQIRIPFKESTFLRKSVTFAGEYWLDMYNRVKDNPNTKLYEMPDEMGTPPKSIDPYARNNLWQLYSALSMSPNGKPENIHFICLWNKKEGDGPGGTKDMYRQIVKYSGNAHILFTDDIFKV